MKLEEAVINTLANMTIVSFQQVWQHNYGKKKSGHLFFLVIDLKPLLFHD